MRNEMALCEKIPQIPIYVKYALFAGCSLRFQAAASGLERPFSGFYNVEVFQSLLKPVRTLNEPAKRL